MVLIANGKHIPCAKVLKGIDYIKCLDSSGNCIHSFSMVLDFSGFSVEDGEFSDPPIDDITQLQLALTELAELVAGSA